MTMISNNIIKFAILSYYPSIIATENINVGIIFFNVNSNERRFYHLKNWNRLQSFDDELDISFMKDYLFGLKSQVEENLLNLKKAFDIETFVKYYVNELRFSDIHTATVDDIDEFEILTRKIHMRGDFEHHERLSKDSELKYIKMLLRSNNIEFSNKPITGKYEENINFDYMIGSYGFKNFVFEDKNIKSMITKAKYWAYNALTLQDRYRTIFTYDHDNEKSEEFKTIMKILKEYAYTVIKNDEMTNYLLTNPEITKGLQTELNVNLN